MKISKSDAPIAPNTDNYKELDTLNTRGYAETLANFVKNCETPLTVGIQGEWGSGKTSILNMMSHSIETVDDKTKLKKKNRNAPGKEIYKVIWIDTWEHSLLKSPEECLLSIIDEIITEISSLDKQYSTTQKARKALAGVARGALRIGTSAALGAHAGSVADELLNDDKQNSVKALRNTLHSIIKSISESEEHTYERFIVFVDDLDRLPPKVAVQVLELLKNIFNIEHCVFVLAIDYQVIVKGLAEKFGEPDENNEWEFRAFFDKIIQLPFMMPMSEYKVGEYIQNLLTREIKYFNATNPLLQNFLENSIRLSIGHNPRAMKRLVNSVSLINTHNEKILNREIASGKKNALASHGLKKLIFAIVCIQISYPKVFELIFNKPDFMNWRQDFARKFVADEKNYSEAEKVLDLMSENYPEDFDEDWEKALFLIMWSNRWQRDRIVEVSQFLSVVLTDIFEDTKLNDEDILETMREAIKMTAVTSVASIDSLLKETVSSKDAEIAKGRRNYWKKLCEDFKGTGCVFDPGVNPTGQNFSEYYLKHRSKLVKHLEFCTSAGSSTPLSIDYFDNTQSDKLNEILTGLKASGDLDSIVKTKFDIKLTDKGIKISFDPPGEIKKRKYLHLAENSGIAKDVRNWLVKVVPKLEEKIKEVITDFDSA